VYVLRERQERAALKAARAQAREAEKAEKERLKSLRKVEKEARKAERAIERELMKEKMDEEKQRRMDEREAERERRAAEKEADKERRRAETAGLREAEKQKKLEELEMKRLAREQEKEARRQERERQRKEREEERLRARQAEERAWRRLPESGPEDTQLVPFSFGLTGPSGAGSGSGPGEAGAQPQPAPMAPHALGDGWRLEAGLVPGAIAAIEYFTVYAQIFEPFNTAYSWRMLAQPSPPGRGGVANVTCVVLCCAGDMESALVDRNEKGYILAYRMHAALLKVLLRELKERKDKATEWFHSLPVTETNFPDLARWFIGESDMPHEAEEQYAGAWPAARHGACYKGQEHTMEPLFSCLLQMSCATPWRGPTTTTSRRTSGLTCCGISRTQCCRARRSSALLSRACPSSTTSTSRPAKRTARWTTRRRPSSSRVCLAHLKAVRCGRHMSSYTYTTCMAMTRAQSEVRSERGTRRRGMRSPRRLPATRRRWPDNGWRG
jgi:chemotaxis protein histidine kinase CheA